MYHFIINPKSSSGRGIRFWWIVKDELEKQQISYSAVFTKHVGHATELARQICMEHPGIKNLVILGGDGTVNEVINGIEDYSKILLGYIPSGSSNDLARSLGIPKDPLEALCHILKPTNFKYLDYGMIRFIGNDTPDRKFACSSGMGYDANVCLEVAKSPLKKSLNRFGAGKFVYIAIAMKQLLTADRIDATVIVNGNKKNTYKNILMVSNMIHKFEGGGIKVAPNANPTDGLLSVCLVHGLSRGKAFLLLPTIFIGKHIKFKGVETIQCTEIEIISKSAATVHTDGEVASIDTHIIVSCVPKKIRMIL